MHPWRNRLKIAARRARQEGVPSTLTEKEWLSVLDKYGHRCLKCGSGEHLEIDHVVPMSKGGPNSATNIQPLCTHCNSSKLDTYADYRPEKDRAVLVDFIEHKGQTNLIKSSRGLPGIKNPKAKLNENDIILIRASSLPSRILAKQFHVGVWTINDIKAGRTWQHISNPSAAH